MFERFENTTGNITGDYNKVIQIILQDGKEVAEKLGILVDRLLNKEKDEIETLQKRISDKEEAIQDKTKIVDLQDAEIIRLKTTLSEKQQQLEASEAHFAKTFLENDGKDFRGSEELYPKALQLLTEGKKKEALAILNRHELLERKKKRDKENEQEAASWLLRADLLKGENIWGEELSECYDFAAEIFSSWINNLSAAHHYYYINSFHKAQHYCEICLVKAGSDDERATSLNNLGLLLSDQNQYEKALQAYREALKINQKLTLVNPQIYLPNVAANLNNLGGVQRAQNEYEKASKSYAEALEIYRKLAAVNSKVYLPDVGMTLNNLGLLQSDQHEYGKAAESYVEAVEIYKKLVLINPQRYLPNVAATLNNLGNLQGNQNEYIKAAQFYTEVLEIYRELAAVNPQTYLPNVAIVLNNLGNLQRNKNEYLKAEQSCAEALKIYRKIVAVYPKTYLPKLGVTLNNLGNIQSAQNEYVKALQSYEEAIEIYRKLALEYPKTYLPEMGGYLHNLGNLQSRQNDYVKASKSYAEALEIRRKLAFVDPKMYLPNVASTLDSLGVLQSAQNDYEKAEQSYAEALEIKRKLASVNPQTYLPELGMTLINSSIFYLESKINKRLSFQLVDEAISLLLLFHEIPYIQNYLEVAFSIINRLDINVKEYVEKKIEANSEDTDTNNNSK